MSLSTMTPNGELPVPTQGGAVSLETLARITVLEQELADLKQTIASDTAYGLAKVTNAADVTEENGIALSAMQNNATVNGTLRYEQELLNKNTEIKIWTSESFSQSNRSIYKPEENGTYFIYCNGLKNESGESRLEIFLNGVRICGAYNNTEGVSELSCAKIVKLLKGWTVDFWMQNMSERLTDAYQHAFVAKIGKY